MTKILTIVGLLVVATVVSAHKCTVDRAYAPIVDVR